MFFRKFFAIITAAAVGATMLCSCAAPGNDNISAGTSAETERPEINLPAQTDPNIPDNIVDGSSPDTPVQDEPLPAVTDSEPQPVVTDTEPQPDVTQTQPAQQPGADGMIVDDWREGLDLSVDDPDEIYEEFRVDREHREGYYTKICSETNFPIVHISTAGEREIVSLDDYVDSFIEVMNCDSVYKLDAATAGVRVRGNASANYGDADWIRKNQVSYRIKFTESQSMLGLNDFARCKSWVLLKSYEAAIENYMAFKLAKAINNGDYFSSDSTFVQLYINEEYKGVYLLCEQTQANSERVDLNEAPENYTGTDIGYLVELDNYATDDDHPYFWLNFNKEEITDVFGTSRVPKKYAYSVKNDLYSDEQLDFIERYFEIAWEIPMRAIRDGEYYKIGEGYELVPAQDEFSSAYECVSQVFDIESVVDMYILYEIVNDQDVGGGSFFFAVDFGPDPVYDRVTMVAPWDFDWAYFDYSSEADGGLYAARFKDSYFVNHWGDRSNPWLILFYSADWFRDLVRQKWQERLQYINETIDEVEQTVINNADEFNKDGTRRSGGAKTLINWVRDRVDFLSGEWGVRG